MRPDMNRDSRTPNRATLDPIRLLVFESPHERESPAALSPGWRHVKRTGAALRPLRVGETSRGRTGQRLQLIQCMPALARSFFPASPSPAPIFAVYTLRPQINRGQSRNDVPGWNVAPEIRL